MLYDNRKNNSSFTLIELLVVLALVAILSVVVILTLNPAELIKQARDSNRLSDLSTINTALNLFSADVTGGFMGTSSIVYVSIPSIISTCSNLGLPTLPSGYTYNCVTATSTRNTDGTGWIPVNFQRISSNSPISQLPIDPINTTSTRLYYTYTTGGSWELNSSIEASKNKLGGNNDLVSKDGGSATSLYEIGNNLNLNPIEAGDTSLVGYWNFEEGPSATSSDRSGYGNHGTWYGTSTQSEHYTSGRVGNYAGYLNGSSDYIDAGNGSSLSFSTIPHSLIFWVKMNRMASTQIYFDKRSSENAGIVFYSVGTPNIINKGNGLTQLGSGLNTLSDLGWHNVVFVNTRISGRKFYFDGVLTSFDSYDDSAVNINSNYSLKFGREYSSGQYWLSASVDDVRIYNRALSAAEVLAIYNASK